MAWGFYGRTETSNEYKYIYTILHVLTLYWLRFCFPQRRNFKFLASWNAFTTLRRTEAVIEGIKKLVTETLFSLWHNCPTWTKAASFLRFLDHGQSHTTVAGTPLEGGSARRRELLSDNTQHRNPCPGRYSNPQSQQARGRRPSS